MSLVNTHNEWDPLEEILVGSAIGARTPILNIDLHAIRCRGQNIDHITVGELPANIIEETEEDLNELVSSLENLGVIVHRPESIDLSKKFSTMDWISDGFFNYCPRDIVLSIGNTLIETPMSFRSRFLEPFAYKDLFVKYLKSGARWISAPKPRLQDKMFNKTDTKTSALHEFEPVFDAANVLKLGKDVLYLVSDTGNELGYHWLQSTLGPEYRVHVCRDMYTSAHIDTTIVPLRPGLVLVNPTRVTTKNIPTFFKKWEVLEAPDPVDISIKGLSVSSSAWMSINLLVVNPNLVIVEKSQTPLIKFLEKRDFEVIPLQLRHARRLGGGFHCVTLDIRRKGKIEDYS